MKEKLPKLLVSFTLLSKTYAQQDLPSDRTVCPNPTEHFSENHQICVPNVCFCRYGTKTQSCLSHNAEVCESCIENYDLVDDICTKRTCTCDNGVARGSSECLVNQREECSACDKGFHLASMGDFMVCEKNVCTAE